MSKLSRAVGRIGESATLAVSKRAKELVAQGVEVIDLSAGEPDFPSPPEAVEAAIEALHAGHTKYTAVAGISELVTALAANYERRFDAPWGPDDYVVTAGGKAALYELAVALYDAGDEVVLPSPYWVTFPEQIRLTGAIAVDVPTRSEDSFRLSAQSVLDKLSSKTSVVLLNSPCNPTGAVIDKVDLTAIVEACAERGIYVVADETYERLVYDDIEFPSCAELSRQYPDTVILVGSFSKTYAMTGWRLGYMAGPAPVVKAVRKIQSHLTSNATTFAMYGAAAAIERSEAASQAMLAEYQVRRDLVQKQLDAIPGVECLPPAGAFYAFPKVSDCYGDGIEGSVAFCQQLLDQHQVAAIPGIAFGADEFIRLSFACSRESLTEGVSRLGLFVHERAGVPW